MLPLGLSPLLGLPGRLLQSVLSGLPLRLPLLDRSLPPAPALLSLQPDPPDLLLTAWEEERALPMSRAIADFAAHHGRPGRVAVVIGPEGGIAAEEWEALRALGAVSVTLGPRILRTETAGLCALSVLWAALGEM